MTVFTEAWERQEQVRHQTLLRQLKEELAAHRRTTQVPRISIPSAPSSSSLDSASTSTVATTSNTTAPRLKPKTSEHRDLLKSITVR